MPQIKLARSWTYAPFYHGSVQTIKFCFLLNVMFWAFGEHFFKVVLTWSRTIKRILPSAHLPLGVSNSAHRLALERDAIGRLINVIFQELASFLRSVF